MLVVVVELPAPPKRLPLELGVEVVAASEPKRLPPTEGFPPPKLALPPEVLVLPKKLPPPVVEGEGNEKVGADVLGGSAIVECLCFQTRYQLITKAAQ